MLLACAAPLAGAQNNLTTRRGIADFTMLQGNWAGADLENRSNCATAGVNGMHGTYAQYMVGWNAASNYLTIQESTLSGLSCSWTGFASDTDRLRPSWSGVFSCSDGKQGDFSSTSFLITPTEMQIRVQMEFKNSRGCDADSILGGSRF